MDSAALPQNGTHESLRGRLAFKLQRAVDYLQFAFVQRARGLTISDTPEFEAECTPFFANRLAAAASYLEFGSGGSTVLAAQRGLPFISVESDPFFLAAVERKVKSVGAYDQTKQRYLHADIGLTEAWGAPVLQHARPERVARWRTYPHAPWPAFAALPGPHLVLVDGRFRVACALAAAKFLQGREGEILVDDYMDRPHYHVVEQYLVRRENVGRMARFTPRTDLDLAALDADIERFCADWR